MRVYQAFCVRNVLRDRKDMWGNDVIENTSKEFPWMRPLIEGLQDQSTWKAEHVAKVTSDMTALIFVDYAKGRRSFLSLEIKKGKSRKCIFWISFLGDPAPTTQEVLDQLITSMGG